jgi:hypothetical protein
VGDLLGSQEALSPLLESWLLHAFGVSELAMMLVPENSSRIQMGHINSHKPLLNSSPEYSTFGQTYKRTQPPSMSSIPSLGGSFETGIELHTHTHTHTHTTQGNK